MIPARRQPQDAPTKEHLSITQRLQRLRYEQRNHPLQLPPRSTGTSTPTAQPSTSSLHPAFAHLSLDPPAQPPQSSSSQSSSSASRYRGTAGPSAPASWLSAERETPEQLAEREREARRRAMVPLEEGDGWLVPRRREVPTLVEFCGRAVAADLARGRRASLLLGYVKWLPPRMRLPIVELAPVKCDVGLGQAAIRELLSEEGEEEEDGTDRAEGVGEELDDAPTPHEPPPQSPPETHLAPDDGDDWDVHALTPPIPLATLASSLTILNLSLSTLTTATLASLLLSTSPAGARPTPAFPHLASLHLTACPRLAISEPLLDILTPLLSLRHLSLACLPLGDTFTPSTVLPKLAAATPTLESIDLSFVPGLTGAVLRNVNWDVRWRELRVVGWRRWMFVADGVGRGKEALRERKDEVARELWGVVKAARKEKGRYIKFVT